MKESALQKIMIEASTEVYLKPEKDFPIGEPRFYHIIDGESWVESAIDRIIEYWLVGDILSKLP